MIGSAKQPYLVLNKRPVGQIGNSLEIASETKICLPILHPAIDDCLILLADLNGHLRVSMLKFLQNFRKNSDDKRRNTSNSDETLSAAGEITKQVERSVHAGDGRFGAGTESFSRLTQKDAPRGPFKKLHARCRLEWFDHCS